MKKHYIKLPMFNYSSIDLYIGSIKKCAKQVDKDYPNPDYKCEDNYIPGSRGWTFETSSEKHGHFVLMMLVKKPTIPEIFHESLHAAMYLINITGIRITTDNHEILAYLQGYIADEIKKVLK